ncbi:MAG: DUF559 domain-containing protein [Burkholderiaceae bacterium]
MGPFAMKAQTDRFAKSRARELHRDTIDCERLLRRRLRAEQLGVKFRRQHPFEKYLLDFVCLEHRFVVEPDGSRHHDAAADDDVRTKLVDKARFRVLRFWNIEVIEQMDADAGRDPSHAADDRPVVPGRLSPSPPQPSP